MLTRANKGFTLLELIVVLVILGLLAAIAIPTYSSVISKSRGQTAKTAGDAIARDAVAMAAFDRASADSGDVAAAAAEAGYTADVSDTAAPEVVIDGCTVVFDLATAPALNGVIDTTVTCA